MNDADPRPLPASATAPLPPSKRRRVGEPVRRLLDSHQSTYVLRTLQPLQTLFAQPPPLPLPAPPPPAARKRSRPGTPFNHRTSRNKPHPLSWKKNSPPRTDASGVPVVPLGKHVDRRTKLGAGACGQVFATRCGRFALKQCAANENKEGFGLAALREIAAVQRMTLNGSSAIVTFESFSCESPHFYILMPRFTCDLATFIEKRAPSLYQVRLIMRAMLSAVWCASKLLLLHRDIKPQNILLQLRPCEGAGAANGDALEIAHVALADWGMSRFVECQDVGLFTGVVQTLWYRAPEILLGKNVHDAMIEMWSLGVILCEMFNREPLVASDHDSFVTQVFKIFQVLGTPTEVTWPDVVTLPRFKGKVFPKFVAQPWHRVVPTASAVALSLINAMLQLDPKKRISFEAALAHPFFQQVTVVLTPDRATHANVLEMPASSSSPPPSPVSDTLEQPPSPQALAAEDCGGHGGEISPSGQHSPPPPSGLRLMRAASVGGYHLNQDIQTLVRTTLNEKLQPDYAFLARSERTDPAALWGNGRVRTRYDLVQLLLRLCVRAEYHLGTLFLALEYVDLVLSHPKTAIAAGGLGASALFRDKGLVAVACLLIAAKLSEPFVMPLDTFLDLCREARQAVPLELVVRLERVLAVAFFQGHLYRVTTYTFLKQMLLTNEAEQVEEATERKAEEEAHESTTDDSDEQLLLAQQLRETRAFSLMLLIHADLRLYCELSKLDVAVRIWNDMNGLVATQPQEPGYAHHAVAGEEENASNDDDAHTLAARTAHEHLRRSVHADVLRMLVHQTESGGGGGHVDFV